jgi:hypothetical protein
MVLTARRTLVAPNEWAGLGWMRWSAKTGDPPLEQEVQSLTFAATYRDAVDIPNKRAAVVRGGTAIGLHGRVGGSARELTMAEVTIVQSVGTELDLQNAGEALREGRLRQC